MVQERKKESLGIAFAQDCQLESFLRLAVPLGDMWSIFALNHSEISRPGLLRSSLSSKISGRSPTIQAAEPVYQVQPALPAYGESGPSTLPGMT